MIKIIAVGKIKERYLEEAIAEYTKRLSAYTKLQLIQVADEKAPEHLSEKEAELIRDKEAVSILRHIRQNDYVVSLEIGGESLSSEAFAKLLERLPLQGHPDVVFVIGGSIGLGSDVIRRADKHVSFSAMTFPHQLMRVILLEQIYRAYKIIKKEPYHK